MLALDLNNGNIVYEAKEMSSGVDQAVIKEPKNGRKVTEQEFRQELDKMLQENSVQP
jgi:hypothetical protein